jgi:hypothetical protein
MLLLAYTIVMLGYWAIPWQPQRDMFPLPPPPADSWTDVLFQLGEPFLASLLVIALVIAVFSFFGQVPSLFAIPAGLSLGVTANSDILLELLWMDGGLLRCSPKLGAGLRFSSTSTGYDLEKDHE